MLYDSVLEMIWNWVLKNKTKQNKTKIGNETMPMLTYNGFVPSLTHLELVIWVMTYSSLVVGTDLTFTLKSCLYLLCVGWYSSFFNGWSRDWHRKNARPDLTEVRRFSEGLSDYFFDIFTYIMYLLCTYDIICMSLWRHTCVRMTKRLLTCAHITREIFSL